MSESAPFSIGVLPDGQPEKAHVDAEYLVAKEFAAIDETRFSKEIEPGKVLIYDLATLAILIQKGDSQPIVVAEHSPGTNYLESIWKNLTGSNL